MEPLASETIWVLGRAVDGVQTIQRQLPRYRNTSPTLKVLSEHANPLIGIKTATNFRLEFHLRMMWYVKSVFMVVGDRARASLSMWSNLAVDIAIYQFVKRALGICVSSVLSSSLEKRVVLISDHTGLL